AGTGGGTDTAPPPPAATTGPPTAAPFSLPLPATTVDQIGPFVPLPAANAITDVSTPQPIMGGFLDQPAVDAFGIPLTGMGALAAYGVQQPEQSAYTYASPPTLAAAFAQPAPVLPPVLAQGEIPQVGQAYVPQEAPAPAPVYASPPAPAAAPAPAPLPV